MSEEISHPRRNLIGDVAKTIAAAQLGVIGTATARAGVAQRAELPPTNHGIGAPLAPLKQVDAGVLNVGYVDAGPANGPAVVLLHGWPYDIHSYVDVIPVLVSA